MDMKDREEKLIYSRLSNIEVDDSNIKSRVMAGLNSKKTRKRPILRFGLGVVLSLFLVVGASAALLKNSEWFMNKFNPIFRDIVDPIDIYSEDQGIKVELIAGQKYDNNAIVYLSIQDTSGKNRITEETEFRDGLFVGLNSQVNSFGYGVKDRLISFDKDTNTIYYELKISTDMNSPLSESLRLGTSKIYFDLTRYEDELLELAAKDLEDRTYFELEESKNWGGKDLSSSGEKILEIGRYSDMPHGHKDQWISNIGIIDGRLHIQLGSNFKKDFGPSSAYFTIRDGEGEPLVYEGSRIFLTDGEGKILEIDEFNPDLAEYKYEEFIFPPVGEREVYELYYTGYISHGVSGHWEVETDLTRDSKNMKTIDREISLGDYKFEKISLSPLGLKLAGSYEGRDLGGDFKIDLVTKEGLLELENAGGSLDRENSSFDLDYRSHKVIRIEEVEALIIDGFKIELDS